MNIRDLNHFNILTADLEKTRKFYMEVLGLREGYRPDLGFPGAWLYVGDRAVLHIVQQKPIPLAGVIDHVAFTGRGLNKALKDLERKGIKYDLVHQIGSKVWQVFFYDPNGAKIELDFPPDEAPPPGWVAAE